MQALTEADPETTVLSYSDSLLSGPVGKIASQWFRNDTQKWPTTPSRCPSSRRAARPPRIHTSKLARIGSGGQATCEGTWGERARNLPPGGNTRLPHERTGSSRPCPTLNEPWSGLKVAPQGSLCEGWGVGKARIWGGERRRESEHRGRSARRGTRAMPEGWKLWQTDSLAIGPAMRRFRPSRSGLSGRRQSSPGRAGWRGGRPLVRGDQRLSSISHEPAVLKRRVQYGA